MGNCYADDLQDWACGKAHHKQKVINTLPIKSRQNTLPLNDHQNKQSNVILNYIRPNPKTLEETIVNNRIDYVLNGFKHDLFPANYMRSGKRRSWGVGTDIPSNTSLCPEIFAFDELFKKCMYEVIKFSKSLKGNYGNSGPPQLILNYKNGIYKLTIECYDRDGNLIKKRIFQLNKNITCMYLRTIIEENLNLYDLCNATATYENNKN